MRPAGLRGLLIAALLVVAGCGGEEREQTTDPFMPVDDGGPAEVEGPRAAPHWEEVASLSGSTTATERFVISNEAIQWRVRWRCRSGRLRIAAADDGLVDARCSDSGESSAIRTGPIRLDVEAADRWSATIEQQVDTPISEPPLPEMTAPAAEVIARGDFRAVERASGGRALLYRLGSGRLALRFEGFETSANSDLFVWLSEAPGPRTTKAAFRPPHTVLAGLKATAGDQNYLLPEGTDPERIRSIVIWCEPVRIAYAAAAMSTGVAGR